MKAEDKKYFDEQFIDLKETVLINKTDLKWHERIVSPLVLLVYAAIADLYRRVLGG